VSPGTALAISTGNTVGKRCLSAVSECYAMSGPIGGAVVSGSNPLLMPIIDGRVNRGKCLNGLYSPTSSSELVLAATRLSDRGRVDLINLLPVPPVHILFGHSAEVRVTTPI
jgi:hypothetical protein